MKCEDNRLVTTSTDRDASNLAGAGAPTGADALPHEARETVAVEGAAGAMPAAAGSRVAAWLFHLDQTSRTCRA